MGRSEEIQAHAAEMRQRNRLARGIHRSDRKCVDCGRESLDRKHCKVCAANHPRVSATPKPRSARLCITCNQPIRERQEYCNESCAEQGLLLKSRNIQEWDGARMIADLNNYLGPYPFPASHWPQIVALAIG